VILDELHILVQSMTKSEKRYFKLTACKQTSAKGFVRLFDSLLRHETTDTALLTELTHQFPGPSLEPARKYLYRVLMQSIRQFEQGKRVDVRIAQLLQDSQILFERGLIKVSQEQLERALMLASEYERGLYGVLAARQQLEQWVRLQFDGVDESMLANLHVRVTQETERSQTALHHAALYETLLLRYRTQGVADTRLDTLQLNDLLLEEHQLLNRQKQKSFAIQQQHLHFQSAYFRMTGDGAGSLRVYQELDNLFQRNPSLWAE
jgi:hypothetical protein